MKESGVGATGAHPASRLTRRPRIPFCSGCAAPRTANPSAGGAGGCATERIRLPVERRSRRAKARRIADPVNHLCARRKHPPFRSTAAPVQSAEASSSEPARDGSRDRVLLALGARRQPAFGHGLGASDSAAVHGRSSQQTRSGGPEFGFGIGRQASRHSIDVGPHQANRRGRCGCSPIPRCASLWLGVTAVRESSAPVRGS